MKKILLILLIVSITQIAAQQKEYSQKEVDSFNMKGPNPKKLGQFKMMLESNEDLVGWMSYYRQKCYYHLVQRERDSVLFYGKIGLQYLSQKKLSKEKFSIEEKYVKEICLYIGIVLNNKRQYRESTEYLLKATAFSKKYPDYNSKANPWIISNLANNYLIMGDKKKAFDYRLKLTKDSVYMSIPREVAIVYNHLGILYEEFGKKDSALYCYKKSLENRIMYDNYAGIRAAYNNMGDLYREENNIDSMLHYYRKSYEVLKAHPEPFYTDSKYFTLANYGYVLLKDGKTNDAIQRLNIVLDSTKHINKIGDNVKSLKINTMSYLIEAYQKNNQLDKALEVSEQKVDVLKKFHQQVLDEKLRELNIAYEVKEKEESIEQLETTTEQQSSIIKQRNFISLVLAGLLLSISGIGFLIFRQRKLKNKYETANLEQRLLRSQLNPHFVFNALNTVSSLANKKSENTSSYIAKLSSLIRLILKNSREEFVSLEDELKSIDDYLELQSNFSQKFTYQIEIENKIDLEETYIPPMFIRPFIENAIEHGLRGVEDGNISVDIKINETDKLLECKITDNGIGVVKASAFKRKNEVEDESFSGKILKERLQIYSRSLNKKAKYTTEPISKEKGTEVNISLPYIFES